MQPTKPAHLTAVNPWRMEGAVGNGDFTVCALPCTPCLLQGIVLPAFETMDDGEVGKQTALKAIKSECCVPRARGTVAGCSASLGVASLLFCQSRHDLLCACARPSASC